MGDVGLGCRMDSSPGRGGGSSGVKSRGAVCCWCRYLQLAASAFVTSGRTLLQDSARTIE